tara:strand:+ start:8879 stop:9661 length:783 start_codon:yes stop_codon:yes gene_type:complete
MNWLPNHVEDYYDHILSPSLNLDMSCYLFDVDGTLTPARSAMGSDFTFAFLSWMANRKVYLVSGSDKQKISQQLPQSVLSRCGGIFASMANEFWQKEKLIYKNEWCPSPSLMARLTDFRELSPYKNKRDEWIEMRTGMINFSVVGRASTKQERQEYSKWDEKNLEREDIIKSLSKDFPDLEFKIGGQISIDIQPAGNNKSLASRWVRENVGEKIIFFGDKVSEDGNDFDIAKDVLTHGGTVHAVNSPIDTQKILKSYYAN